MEKEIGVAKGRTESDGYTCRFAVNMDCFLWVKRDSYLPQGSQGLKAPPSPDPQPKASLCD